MIRKVIKIDEEKCNGCTLCVTACHEGAIIMKNGKATLLRDDYCDGLGDCLPACPTNAISFETREALPYDEAAVLENMKKKNNPTPMGCPGSQAQAHSPKEKTENPSNDKIESELTMWPVQIQLVAPNAFFFEGADLLVAADCSAFAYGNFHRDFMQGKVTLIGCPKLDNADYQSKLTEIITNNNIKSVTVVRMQVPCCGGIEFATTNAVANSGKALNCKVVTLSTKGDII